MEYNISIPAIAMGTCSDSIYIYLVSLPKMTEKRPSRKAEFVFYAPIIFILLMLIVLVMQIVINSKLESVKTMQRNMQKQINHIEQTTYDWYVK